MLLVDANRLELWLIRRVLHLKRSSDGASERRRSEPDPPAPSARSAGPTGWTPASWWTPVCPAGSSSRSAPRRRRCSPATWLASGGTSPGSAPESTTSDTRMQHLEASELEGPNASTVLFFFPLRVLWFDSFCKKINLIRSGTFQGYEGAPESSATLVFKPKSNRSHHIPPAWFLPLFLMLPVCFHPSLTGLVEFTDYSHTRC